MAEEKFDFDKKAASWDENPARVKLANDVAAAVLDEKILTPEMDVLEFGCGTGLLTVRLSPLVRSITAVDGSQGMLSVIDAKIEARGLKNIHTQLLDPSRGGILQGGYHAVLSGMVLHHVKETGPLIEQFYSVTLPGGHLILADLDPDEGKFHGENPTVFHDGFDRKLLGDILLRAGYSNVRDKTAAVVKKPAADGSVQAFSVFLITCRKEG